MIATRRLLRTRSDDAKIELMASLELFEGLARHEVLELAKVFELTHARPGQVLQRCGSRVQWWYLVVSGTATLDQGAWPAGLVSGGGSWGERSIVLGQASPVTVVALSPMILLAIDRRRLHGLWDQDSQWSNRLFDRFLSAERLVPDFVRPELLGGGEQTDRVVRSRV
jgi:CRP-like cAMP-binding protein